MHPLSESGFSFDKLSPVSFQPSTYLRLLESHMQNETHHSDHRTEVQSSHGHTEVQSSHGHTEIQSSHGHTEVQSSHGHTEVQSSHGHTEVQSSHGHTEVQSSHGHTEIQQSHRISPSGHTESSPVTVTQKSSPVRAHRNPVPSRSHRNPSSSHRIQSSHGHTEIQSSHGHTKSAVSPDHPVQFQCSPTQNLQSFHEYHIKPPAFIHRTLQLTGLPSSYKSVSLVPDLFPFPSKCSSRQTPQSLLSFTPGSGRACCSCTTEAGRGSHSQVNGVMHRSKPITFLTTYYCYRQSWFYFLPLLWCFLSLLPLNTLQRKVQSEITRQFNKKSIKERAQQLSCLFTGKPPQPQVKS